MLLASGDQGGPPRAWCLELRPEGVREQVLWGEQNLLLAKYLLTDPTIRTKREALW